MLRDNVNTIKRYLSALTSFYQFNSILFSDKQNTLTFELQRKVKFFCFHFN